MLWQARHRSTVEVEVQFLPDAPILLSKSRILLPKEMDVAIKYILTLNCRECSWLVKCHQLFEDNWKIRCRAPDLKRTTEIIGVLEFNSYMSRTIRDEPLKFKVRYLLELVGYILVSYTRRLMKWVLECPVGLGVISSPVWHIVKHIRRIP